MLTNFGLSIICITFTHEIKTTKHIVMKTIEKFFESANFDSKNITNKSNVVLSEANVNSLESEGATFELLETLGVPVYKYRTQITIHGLFPSLKNNYIGGYKNLFQNKNLSIGVKYNAIDRFKKQQIFDTVKAFLNVDGSYNWKVTDNSTEYGISKISETFNTRAEYLTLLPQFEALAKTINEKLFFGNIQVYLGQTYFGYVMVLSLNIGAIKTENVIPLIENICGTDINTINAKIEADKQARETARAIEKAEREKAKLVIDEKTKPIKENAIEYLKSLGYVKETVKLFDGLVALVNITVNSATLDVTYKFKKYSKTKAQKQFRNVSAEYVNEIPSEITFESNGYNEFKTDKNEIVCYVKKINHDNNKPIEKTKSVEVPNLVVNNSNVRIVEYSEKSFAVVGDTKPIKDILLNLGGKYNRYLTVGVGWIFSNKKKTEVMKTLKLA